MDIKILKDLFLMIERGNPLKYQDQTIHKRIMVHLGLLKSGSGAAKHDRSGKLEENSWDSLRKVDPHREEYLLCRTAPSARNEEKLFPIERGNPFQRISKERLILKISLFEVS